MIRTASTLALIFALAAPSIVAAQSCTGCSTDDTVPRGHITPALGFHVGAPQKVSLGLGVLLGEDWQHNGHDHTRNIAVFAEPGLSGGRASIAFLDHGYGSFGSGFGIAGTVLRTWRDPWNAKPNVTYVGAEAYLWPVLLVGPRVGLFHSVAGTSRADRWMISFGIGIGI